MGEPSNADEKMDDLADLMAAGSSMNDYTATEKHPHFDNYKNVGKIATSQKERRAEHLERQRERRRTSFNRQRSLVEDIEEEDGEDEIEYVMETGKARNPFGLKKIPISKRYKDKLMLSEWLIDIPNELHGSWTMVVSPQGRRRLVVAKDGITKVYNKHGFCAEEFKSGLPGGNDETRNEKTILDCIKLRRESKTYYILDIIYANKKSYCEVEAIKRFQEIDPLVKSIVPQIKNSKEKLPKFLASPRCSCNAEEMTKMMSEPNKRYSITGFLFYNNEGWYTPGYTPLVGWLEPWMFPEVLNIPIHESYKNEKRSKVPLKEYVDAFNDRHNHHYVHGKPWEEIAVREEEATKEDGEGKMFTD